MRSPARMHWVVAALLLLLMALLAGGAVRRESITVDEVAHLGAGVSYVQKLDYRMNEEHPPLAKVVAAMPLVLRGVRTDYFDVSWSFSKGLFQSLLGEWAWGHQLVMRWNDPRTTLWHARLAMLAMTLALGLALFVFGSKLGGGWGGILCLACFTSYPAFLAFGPLVLTDVPVTLFCVLTVWTLADLWRAPSRGAALRFGLAFGGALLSKFSSGLLLFGFAAFILVLRWLPLSSQPKEPDALREWRRMRRAWLWKGILFAAVLVYGVYFILSWNQPTDSLRLLGSGVLAAIARRLLMPPWLYLRGLAIFVLMSSRGTFILGHSYTHGVWFYFPVLFVLKSPLAFLLLLLFAAAIATMAKRRLPRGAILPAELEFHWRALWVFLAVFVAACMLSRLDLSIRHFTVPIALMILLLAPLPRTIAGLARAVQSSARFASAVAAVLACASLATAVRAYPYYLPFLNSLSFGKPGYALVNDSNLDWNQALPDAAHFVEQRGIKRVLLDEYGFSDPTIYVPAAQFWDCQQPSAADAGRWAIVSAGVIEDGQNCLWLMSYPHEALGGGSMYAVQLPAIIPAAGEPGGPPLSSAYKYFGGMPAEVDARAIFWKCVENPTQLQPTFDAMMAQFAEVRNKH